jgi:hypothetical protein
VLEISIDKCDLKLQEASQVGEAVKESRGEIHFSHFVGCTRRNGRSKSSEEISRSFEDH